ncbi:MAG TPA: hypothetical protein VN896_05335 [Methylomirabilota bacterium]|nr:hypothetical protein [Methylomirabilota bacterium]
MARADLLERVRRPAFMVTLGFALWAANLFTPPLGAPYVTLQIHGHRGIYNSEWVGAMTAILCVMFFSIAGFYLTRSAVDNDRRTGVGAILGTTAMSRLEYTLAKWLANYGLLAAMVAVVAIGAAAMQMARGEDRHLDLLAIATPFACLVLPAMAITAGVAVLFETVPGLRGGLGNAVFLFTWMPAIAAVQLRTEAPSPWSDPLGVNMVLWQMIHAAGEQFADVRANPGSYSMGFTFRTGGWHLTTFRWDGPEWTPLILVSRLVWVVFGAGLAAVAAIPFDRFAGERGLAKKRARANGAAVAVAGEPTTRVLAAHASDLVAPAQRGRGALGRLVVAELRLMFHGLPRIWFVVPLGLVIASAFVPIAAAGKVAGIAWVWPVLQWSQLGSRDRRHGTEALMLSSPHPIARPMAAAWIAGFALALAMGAGLSLRSLLHGDVMTFAAVLAGAAFVPAMALALGTWTGASKTFEILYLVLWYAGPLNGIPFLDYAGGTGAGAARGFAIAAAILLALACAGRARQLRR